MKSYYYGLVLLFSLSVVHATINIGAHNIYDNGTISTITVNLYGNGSLYNFSGSTSNGTVNTYLVNGTPYNSSIVPFLYQTITRPIYGFINPSFEAFNSTNWLNYTLTNTAAYTLSASTSNVVLGTYSALLSDSFVGGSNSTATLTQQINVTEVKNITLNITAVTNKIGGSTVVCGGIEITLSMSGATSLRSVSSCDNTFDGSPVTTTDSAVLDTTGLNGTQTLTITIKENDAGANAFQTFQVYAYLDALTVNYNLNATPINGIVAQALDIYDLTNIQEFNITYNITEEIQSTIGNVTFTSTCTNPGFAYDGNFFTETTCAGGSTFSLYQNFSYNSSWNNQFISWKTKMESAGLAGAGLELAIYNYTAGGFQGYKYYTGTFSEVENYTYLSANSLGLSSSQPLQVRLLRLGAGAFNYSEGAVLFNGTTNEFDSTTNGYISVPFYNATTVNVSVKSVGYLDRDYTNYNASTNLTAMLYPRTITARIFDELTGNVLNTVTVNAIAASNSLERTNSTTNGTMYVKPLPDDNYSMTFSASGYNSRTYLVDLPYSSSASVDAYLSNSTQNVTFLVLDRDVSTLLLEDAVISMASLINSTWTTVQTKSTDITGIAVLSYTPDTKYRFTISKTGYESSVFYLDPINPSVPSTCATTACYQIKLVRDNTFDDTQDYANIGIVRTPTLFYDDQRNVFVYTITSPDGNLQNYTINITYPGGSNQSTGTNSYGGTVTFYFNITGASFFDKVVVTDTYYSGGVAYPHVFYYTITTNSTSNIGTIAYHKNYNFDLGDFERVFIATLVTLIVAGGVSLYVEAPAAGITIVLMFGLFFYNGLIPLWGFAIAGFVGFVTVTWRSSQ